MIKSLVYVFTLFLLCLGYQRGFAQDDPCLVVRAEVLTDTVVEAEGAEIFVRFSLDCPAQDTVNILPLIKPPINSPNANSADFRNAAGATGVTILPGMISAVSKIPVTNDEHIEPSVEHFYWDYEVKSNIAYTLAPGSAQIEFWIKDDDNDPANKKYTLTYNPKVQEGEALKIDLNFPSGKRFPDSLKLRFEPEEVPFNAQINKDYSVIIRNLPPPGEGTSIDISALTDKLIEGDEFIRGRIVIYDAGWDDASTYTTKDSINIKVVDRDTLEVNRVIEITPELTELIEGSRITYTLKITSPYNIERPLTVNINPGMLPGFVNQSNPEIILSEQNATATVTFEYPDNDNVDIEELITVAFSAADPHIGNFTFRFNNEEVAGLIISTLDNDSDIKIPNAFTPNGDGVNDTWVISGIANNQNSLVQIFSRTGEKVFEARTYDNTWNGRTNNKPLPQGVYYYKIFHQKNYPIRTGTVTIVY